MEDEAIRAFMPRCWSPNMVGCRTSVWNNVVRQTPAAYKYCLSSWSSSSCFSAENDSISHFRNNAWAILKIQHLFWENSIAVEEARSISMKRQNLILFFNEMIIRFQNCYNRLTTQVFSRCAYRITNSSIATKIPARKYLPPKTERIAL